MARGEAYTRTEGQPDASLVPNLRCKCPEADQKIVTALLWVAATYPGHNAVINASDTDVIAATVQASLSLPAESRRCVFLQRGASTRDNKVYSVDKVADELESQLGAHCAKGLLQLHTISGCDTVSALYGQGKRKFWNMLKEVSSHLQVAGASTSPSPATTANAEAEAIVSALEALGTPEFYSDKKVNPVHFRSLELLFCRVYATKSLPPAAKDKGLLGIRVALWNKHGPTNVHKLPPTQHALQYHILRAHWQMMVWCASMHPVPAQRVMPDPVGFGWELVDGVLQAVWTAQPPIPNEALLYKASCSCKCNCATRRCSCRKRGLTCGPDRCLCNPTLCQNGHAHDAAATSTLEEELVDEDESSDHCDSSDSECGEEEEEEEEVQEVQEV